jgi:hypothetical protein
MIYDALMRHLNKIKVMIQNEPLSDLEKDSLITKIELINLEGTNNMSTNEKIVNIINNFRLLAAGDQSLIIEILQNTFNKERADQTLQAKEELLKQQHAMQQAEL